MCRLLVLLAFVLVGGGKSSGAGGDPGPGPGPGSGSGDARCVQEEAAPPVTAPGPSLLSLRWQSEVWSALGAARSGWLAVDAPRATRDDWARLARAILKEHRVASAIAVHTDTFRLLVFAKSGTIHESHTGARGFWATLAEYNKRVGAGLGAGAGRGSHGGTPLEQTHDESLWPHPFYVCAMGTWLFGPAPGILVQNSTLAGIFFNAAVLEADPCDPTWGHLLYNGYKCDPNTTECVRFQHGERWGPQRRSYRCQCLHGFGPRAFEAKRNETASGPGSSSSHFFCSPCPEGSPRCGLANSWEAGVREGLKVVQGVCMVGVLVIGAMVFRKRKCKIVASSMWVVLETLLLGALLLQAAVVLRFLEPSLWMCLLEPWCRELGFVICYGAIILKLYRILVEFRTRKAHRWVLKDKELLRSLSGMVLGVFGYLAALTAAALNFYNEGFQLLDTVITDDGMVYPHCKVFWWEYISETGEIVSLLAGLHLSWAARNFNMQFNERAFLSAALGVELCASTALYTMRLALRDRDDHLSPTFVLLAHFLRGQLSTTIVLGLVFGPVLWLARRQAPGPRPLLPNMMDSVKPPDGGAAFHSSDVDVAEISLKDMNHEDIRAELKRLYTQLEILRDKTLRSNNPHISKRRGGRKVPHRRFSLQALQHRHMRSSARHNTDADIAEAEGSRTPEDSVCSVEGPSAVFNDGPSTFSEHGGYGTPNVSYRGSHKQ